jgi:ribosomal protein S18 acetylase RimI-like enzyme
MPLAEEGQGQMIFRAYSEGDLMPLARLWLESWLSTGPAVESAVTEDSNRERIIREISSGWKVTIASEADEIVGFLATKPHQKVLDQLFIKPRAKGRGIERALLKIAMREMPGGFSLRTAADNGAACKFYERNGLSFSHTDTHPTVGYQIAIYCWRPSQIVGCGRATHTSPYQLSIRP